MGASEKIVYLERNSKTYKGGMKQYKMEPRVGEIHPIGGQFCPVKLVKKYIELLPADANSFYCKPKPKFRNGDWYSAVPVGKNTLHNIMKDISIMAGWDQTKLWTGHSL